MIGAVLAISVRAARKDANKTTSVIHMMIHEAELRAKGEISSKWGTNLVRDLDKSYGNAGAITDYRIINIYTQTENFYHLKAGSRPIISPANPKMAQSMWDIFSGNKVAHGTLQLQRQPISKWDVAPYNFLDKSGIPKSKAVYLAVQVNVNMPWNWHWNTTGPGKQFSFAKVYGSWAQSQAKV